MKEQPVTTSFRLGQGPWHVLDAIGEGGLTSFSSSRGSLIGEGCWFWGPRACFTRSDEFRERRTLRRQIRANEGSHGGRIDDTERESRGLHAREVAKRTCDPTGSKITPLLFHCDHDLADRRIAKLRF